jgi:hypothetical protein
MAKRFSAKKSAAVDAGQAALDDLARSLGIDEDIAVLLADEALECWRRHFNTSVPPMTKVPGGFGHDQNGERGEHL